MPPSSASSRFAPAAGLLDDAVERRVFPCASIEVGRRDDVYWRHACGTLSYDAESAPATPDTIFDLASLTKVLATTTVLMRLVDGGAVALEDPVAHWLADWRGEDRAGVSIADLLEHTGGLTAHLPFFRDHHGRSDFQHAICTLPLEYPAGSRSVYSDLGFILLAFIATDAARGIGIDVQFDQVSRGLDLGDLRYRPPVAWRSRTAPTEVDAWRGRLLTGEVHDENGWALSGVAGHTGLFGTAPAVGRFARALLDTVAGLPRLASPHTLARFLRRSTVPGSSRALGWDTMLPTSSCGHRLSPAAIGHTGFTGTSLWIDPGQELYVVLLTNRVYPTRNNEAILEVRPAVHDAIAQALAR
jgi:CubicO group peptidase (beta-lactamase class C family)